MVTETLSHDCLSPALAQNLVSSQLGWLLLQAGYEAFIPEALSCLADIFIAQVEQLCRALKLSLESSHISDPIRLADRLILGQLRSGTGQLLRFLTLNPQRSREKLDRVRSIVEEHKYLTDSNMAIDVEQGELGEAVPDSDLDLGLLGDEPLSLSPHPSLLNMVSFSADRRKREDSAHSLTDGETIDSNKRRALGTTEPESGVQHSPRKKLRPDPNSSAN